MKEYLNQFYNEGLATTFYLRPINYLNKKVKSHKKRKFLELLIKVLYTILVLLFAIYMFIYKWPL